MQWISETREIVKMKRQANDKEVKEKPRWKYSKAAIPYVQGQSKTIRRKLAEEGLPVSFKPHRMIGQMIGQMISSPN